MSKKTNKTDSPLDDLLHPKQDPANLNDFDREALEGFALLDKSGEAKNLKAQLDERMAQAFQKEKKRSLTTLNWLAAASLLLVAGLSIYFLMANEPLVNKNTKELALNPPPPVTSPADKEPEQQIPLIEKPKDQISAQSAPKKSHRQKASPGQMTAQEQGQGISSAVSGAASPLQEENKASADLAAKANTESSRDKAEKNEELSEKKDKVRERATEQEDNIPAHSKAASKKMDQNKTVGFGAGSSAAPSGPANSLAPAMGNCYYNGGDSLLQRELTERLISKNLDKHFEAIVYINSTYRISKVEFIKSAYSMEDRYEASYVIQSLDKFRFRLKPGKDELCTYKIVR